MATKLKEAWWRFYVSVPDIHVDINVPQLLSSVKGCHWVGLKDIELHIDEQLQEQVRAIKRELYRQIQTDLDFTWPVDSEYPD